MAILSGAVQWVFGNQANEARPDILVVVNLAGGLDALHTVPPIGDRAFATARKQLALPRPGENNGILDLDGYFGLHVELARLYELFSAKRLAIVQAVSSPDTTLSHFEASKTLARGVADGNLVQNGWLSRYLASRETGNRSPLQAVAFAHTLPLVLEDAQNAITLRSLSDFKLNVPATWQKSFPGVLQQIHEAGDDAAVLAGRDTLSLLRTVARLQAEPYKPASGVRYRDDQLGREMQQVAQLIKADVGLEVAVLEQQGWDSHANQAPITHDLMLSLSNALKSFHDDLGPLMNRVVVVALSEFGRRVQENSNAGTDHGRGGAMFVIGGQVRGGHVYGRWPGIGAEDLDAGGNIQVTTDYRSVLAEIVEHRLNNPNLNKIFPNFEPEYLGLVTPQRELVEA